MSWERRAWLSLICGTWYDCSLPEHGCSPEDEGRGGFTQQGLEIKDDDWRLHDPEWPPCDGSVKFAVDMGFCDEDGNKIGREGYVEAMTNGEW